jgi:putative chitinase
MPVIVTLDDLLFLAPNIRSTYRKAIENGQGVLDATGITQTSLRTAHFFAQVLHESGGMTHLIENLNYSAKRLPAVWPSRFKPKGPADPKLYAGNPEKLANLVYGGRMGNVNPGDGYKYRGRGLIQITGRSGYDLAAKRVRKTFPNAPDFEQTPEAATSSEWVLAIAATYWKEQGLNEMADANRIKGITKVINGGQNGLKDRQEWLIRCRKVWR